MADEEESAHAAAAAAQVTAAAAAGDAVIADEVAAVADELADHAEVSEERHEQILEGTQWLGQRVDLIQTELRDSAHQILNSMATLAAQGELLSTGQQECLTRLLNLRTDLENLSQRLLPDSMPSIPAVSETAVVVVEPESAAVPEEAKTETVRARRKRVI